jgi:hypothetical protein
MPTSVLDQAPTRPPAAGPTPRHRRRAASLVLVAVLMLLGGGVGALLALAGRPASPAPAPASATTTPPPSTVAGLATAPTGPAGGSGAAQVADQPGPTAQATGSSRGTAAGPAPVLPDGRHPAFVRKVDTGRRTLTVDLVQVFEDEAAVKAAIEDGTPREQAQYLQYHVRNESRRLRTLPMAPGMAIHLLATCEEPATQRVLLAKLAQNASLDDVFYYTLTVRHGTVQAIREHQTHPAC